MRPDHARRVAHVGAPVREAARAAAARAVGQHLPRDGPAADPRRPRRGARGAGGRGRAQERKVAAVVARELEFDAESVREAFRMQKARWHSGKVVVKVASEA